MAVSRLKTWIAGEVLTAADLNAEFNNIVNNGEDLGWPATQAKDLDGQELTLDGDGDSGIVADTDDRMDVKLAGTDLFRFDGTASTPVNGYDFVAVATGSSPYIIPAGSDSNITTVIRGKGTGTVTLADADGNQILATADTASAVNEITVTNAAAGNGPKVGATGDDTNIDLVLEPKGTGQVDFSNATTKNLDDHGYNYAVVLGIT